ncbi:DUF6896 domain-containing protein [Aquimarina sp. 2201CG14-23]|uniref:DUF6896 domain-containing protein n=1 Tax=Aquimarina mycalae TaxID=3040073 RepID=UPI002478291D|nr:hypothetical protein [Aquimarina sp. 2201CG14-23]MDH7447819.1 hypothetical protein [Aquimarina sp. 2201CG14-23]
MNKNLIVKSQNELPEISELNELLSEFKNLTIKLESGNFENDYVIRLQNEMPNFCISEIKHKSTLIIGKSISTQIVLENISEFYNSIELFDKTAHHLMNTMSIKFKIDLNNPSELYEFKTKKNNKQRGQIDNEWNYHFHGIGCSFKNEKTGQFLDIKINNNLEFGVIDNYYLLQFINTTDSLTKIKTILNNESVNMFKATQVLSNHKFLIQYSNDSNKLIINRNKKPRDNNV